MRISRYIYVICYIRKVYKKDFKLYRDDGLGVVRNKCGRETAKIKKCIPEIFKLNKFYIVILTQHENSQLLRHFTQLQQFEL